MNPDESLFFAEQHRNDLLADAAAAHSARRVRRARGRRATGGRIRSWRARSRHD
jgi:hypothetical protein